MAQLTINGRSITARERQTILEAARSAGIAIPTLCWHPDLSVDGSCRLCVVEVDGMRSPPAACSTPESDGMIVRTETPALIESRRFVLEMLLRQAERVRLCPPSRAADEAPRPPALIKWRREA